eukprot:SAG22_NODE_4305_length_1311_cov_0.740924_2_plen_211_part_01
MTADSRPRAKPQSVAEYFGNWLKLKFGSERLIVEMAYNMVDALRRFEYDADCELFLKILFGQLCEQTYHDQMRLVDTFLETCKQYDRDVSGGRQMGLIPRTDFMKLLVAEFSMKTAAEMKNLKRALSTDQPLPSIDYNKLFASDREGNQGKFAELLRDQFVNEVQEMYPAVEGAIRQTVLSSAAKPPAIQLTLMQQASFKTFLNGARLTAH